MHLPGCRACELGEGDQVQQQQAGQQQQQQQAGASKAPQCCLCPVAGGALKPTTIDGVWCHATCMQWVPEVTCLDPSR